MPRGSSGGFTYLGVLLALALMGVGLLAASEVWVTSAQRQKRAQLEWIGSQFERAIGSYYESSPGGALRYPSSLDQLLIDTRYVTVRRHLRQVYANPFTGSAEWTVIRGPDGGISAICAELPNGDGAGVEWIAFGYTPGVAVAPSARPAARVALGLGCPDRLSSGLTGGQTI